MNINVLVILKLLILAICCFSSLSGAETAIENMYKQAETNPMAALEQSQLLLNTAIKSDDKDKQLELLDFQLGIFARFGDMEKMVEVAKKGSDLAQVQLDMEIHYSFKIAIAEAYSQMSRWQVSKKIFLETIEKIKQSGSKEQLIFAKIKLGMAYYYNQQLDRALVTLLEAYDQVDPANLAEQTGLLSNIALIYEASGDSEKAIEFYHKDLEIVENIIPESELSIIYYNIALSYAHLKNFDEAELYLKKSEKIARKFNVAQGIAFVTSELGAIENDKENYEAAYVYLQEASELAQQLNNARLEQMVAFSMAKTLTFIGKFIEAEKLINDIDSKMVNKTDEDTITLHQFRSDLYLQKGDFLLASEELKSLLALYKTELKENSKKGIHEMQAKFNNKIQEQENQLLKKDNELQRLKIADQANEQKMYLIIFVGLVLVLLFTVIYLRREKEVKRKFAVMAMTDELTGVSNRRKIMEHAQLELTNYQRYRSPITIAILDLDHFKKINDNYGHNIGDLVLIGFAKAVEKVIRKQDLFGRIGGEEWMLIFPQTEISYTQLVFDRINTEVTKLNIAPINQIVTFSMGVTQLLELDLDMESPLKRADEALYQAKENGRNCYVVN